MRKSFKEIQDGLRSSSETRRFDSSYDERQKPKFDIEHLDAADRFLRSVDQKCRDKIDSVIQHASRDLNSKLFKKLTDDIWEFRIRSGHVDKNKTK